MPPKIETRTTGLPLHVGARGARGRNVSLREDPAGGRHVAGNRLVSPPSEHLAALAAHHAQRVAAMIELPTVPVVRWFHRERGDQPRAFVLDSHMSTVFVGDDIAEADLERTVAHEVAHLWQFERHPDLTEDDAEAAAYLFADQVAGNGGHIQRSEPPWLGTRAWPAWTYR